MFVGHYSASFLAKSLNKNIPLWLLFIAVQFVDVLWAILVLGGIEKVRIIPGFTESNQLDLYFMPYTHSLIGAIGWSIFAFAVYYFWKRRETDQIFFAASLVGVAVFSHWILDLLMHVPDLGLFGDSQKVGFGLWNYPQIALPLEFAILIGSFWLYMRSTSATSAIGKVGFPVFVVFLISVQLLSFFDTSESTASNFAIIGLVSYLLLAAITRLAKL